MCAVCRPKQGHCAAFAHARAPCGLACAAGWRRTTSCYLVVSRTSLGSV